MHELAPRTVFFVQDAERALRFYTDTLGFTVDWTHLEHGRVFVFQVSLLGLQLILNQTEADTAARAGHGRVFIGVDSDQVEALRRHLTDRNIKTSVTHWGAPTLIVHDLDQNEFFFWLPEGERADLEARLAAPRSPPRPQVT